MRTFARSAIRFAKVLAWTALAVLLVLVVVTALGIYLNHRAMQSAITLCDALPLGTDLPTVLALAKATDARHVGLPDRHVFRFQGWVFNVATCEVKTSNGQVIGKSVGQDGD